MESESYVGIVEKVIVGGRHGPYAVATVENVGLVTFSLQTPVWDENDYPERGIMVVLTKIRKKRAGWRAEHGRFFKPSDQAQSKE